MRLRCDEIFSDRYIANFLKSVWAKEFWKIDQYLGKLWLKRGVVLFLIRGVSRVFVRSWPGANKRLWSLVARTYNDVVKGHYVPFVGHAGSVDEGERISRSHAVSSCLWHTGILEIFFWNLWKWCTVLAWSILVSLLLRHVWVLCDIRKVVQPKLLVLSFRWAHRCLQMGRVWC